MQVRKTKAMIVSWSRTIHPQLTPLTLDGTVLNESADFVLLEGTFDAKRPLRGTFALFPELLPRGLVYYEKVLASIS